MADTGQTVVEALKVPKDSDMYEVIINPMLVRKAKKFDNVHTINGYEGVGKSTESRFMAANYDPRYTFEKDLIFSDKKEEDIMREFRTKARGSVFDFDEAVDIAYKYEWQKAIQKTINIEMTKIRERRHAILLNIPSFMSLNPYFRKERIYYQIQIIDRGYAVVFERSDDEIYNKDPFKIAEVESITNEWYDNFGKPKSLQNKVEMISTYPTFAGHFKFPKTPRWVERKYEAMRDKAKLKFKQQQDPKDDTYNKTQARQLDAIKRGATFLNKKCGLLQKDVGTIFGYSRRRITELMNTNYNVEGGGGEFKLNEYDNLIKKIKKFLDEGGI